MIGWVMEVLTDNDRWHALLHRPTVCGYIGATLMATLAFCVMEMWGKSRARAGLNGKC